MDDIRIPLLGLGLLLIAGIYIWGRTMGFRRQRRNRRRKPEFRSSGTRIREVTVSATPPPSDHLDTDVPSLSMDESPVATGKSARLPRETLAPEPETQAKTGPRDRPGETLAEEPVQVEFAFDQAEAESGPSPEIEIEAEPAPAPRTMPDPAPDTTVAPQEEILPLYVCAAEGHSYHGRDILRAVNDVGMNFGKMNIFQHYGIGDLASDTPLFNMANMLEPGSFDLSQIDELETTGLALFMALPGPADSLLVFELMLNTAERLVQHLGGEIRDQHQHVVDAAAIDRLRQRAAVHR